MIRRSSLAALFATTAVLPFSANAQAPTRAIRRDIPLTNAIRRALAAGTRDSTGRPGRNYWQLWMDYKIDARFDNSANNRMNPDPKKTIRWGAASETEMMDGWVEYVDALPGVAPNKVTLVAAPRTTASAAR